MSLGGRKFIVAILTLIGGAGFGLFCALKGVDLYAAAFFWGSCTIGPLGYNTANVMQDHIKAKYGNNGKAAPTPI